MKSEAKTTEIAIAKKPKEQKAKFINISRGDMLCNRGEDASLFRVVSKDDGIVTVRNLFEPNSTTKYKKKEFDLKEFFIHQRQ